MAGEDDEQAERDERAAEPPASASERETRPLPARTEAAPDEETVDDEAETRELEPVRPPDEGDDDAGGDDAGGDDAAGDDAPVSAPRTTETRPRGRKRAAVLTVLLVIALGLVAAGAYGLFWFWERLPLIVLTRANEEARLRGLVLNIERVEIPTLGEVLGDLDGRHQVRLVGVDLGLVDAPNVSGRTEAIRIDVERRGELVAAHVSPLSLEVDGARGLAELVGFVLARAGDPAPPAPLTIEGVTLAVDEDGAPLARLESRGITLDADRGALEAVRIEALGRSLGPWDLAWQPHEASGLELSLTIAESKRYALHLVRSEAEGALTIAAQIADEPLAPLFGALGVETDLTQALASGNASIAIVDRSGRPASITGSFEGALDGYVPPHPRELAGILHEKRTRASGRFEVADDRRSLSLSDLTIVSGALRLRGQGSVAEEGEGARIRLALEGALPCAQLGASALAAHLDWRLATLGGEVLRRAVAGNVGIGLRVNAHTRTLRTPEVAPSAVLRCTLRLF